MSYEKDLKKKVIKLAKELEGKNLRSEWSQKKNKYMKDHTLSLMELHRAFAVIGSAQKAAAEQEGKEAIEFLGGKVKVMLTAAQEAEKVKKAAVSKLKKEEAKKAKAAKKEEAVKAEKSKKPI